jgi:hypothetical protein
MRLRGFRRIGSLQGERQARLSIAIDTDRSQIRGAQHEELADLELGDVLGEGFIAELLE